MKGLWAQRPLLFQLLVILFLLLTGGLLFTGLAMGISVWLYEVPVNNLALLLSGTPGSAQHEALLLIQAMGSIGVFAFPAMVGSYLLFNRPEEQLGAQAPNSGLLVGLILTVILGIAATGPVDLLLRLSQALPIPGAWETYFANQQVQMEQQYRHFLQMNSPLDFTKVLLVMAVIPALCEELLFRGLLQGLLKRWGIHLAVWVSAALFASIHGQFYAFLSILVLGAALGYLRQWSGSLLWPTVLHFVNNAGIVIQVYFFKASYDNMDSAALEVGYLQSALLTMAFVALMALAYRYFRR